MKKLLLALFVLGLLALPSLGYIDPPAPSAPAFYTVFNPFTNQLDYAGYVTVEGLTQAAGDDRYIHNVGAYGRIDEDILIHTVTTTEALAGGFYIPWSGTTADRIVDIGGVIYINGNGQQTIQAINLSYYIINYQQGTAQFQVAGGIGSGEVWTLTIQYKEEAPQ